MYYISNAVRQFVPKCSIQYYSGPPLMWPPLMHWNGGHIRGVASGEGDITMVKPHLLHGKVATGEGVASLEGGHLRGGPLYVII